MYYLLWRFARRSNFRDLAHPNAHSSGKCIQSWWYTSTRHLWLLEDGGSSWGVCSSHFLKGHDGLCGSQSGLLAEGSLGRGPTFLSPAARAECSRSPQSQASKSGERGTVSPSVLICNPKSYLILETWKPVGSGSANAQRQCSVVERDLASESEVLVWVSLLPWLATWLGAGLLTLLTVAFLVCPMARTRSSLMIS